MVQIEYVISENSSRTDRRQTPVVDNHKYMYITYSLLYGIGAVPFVQPKLYPLNE